MKNNREQESAGPRQEISAAMKSFFEQPAGLHLICGLDGTIERVNASWQEVIGYAPEELEGRSIQQLIHPDDKDATLAEMAKLAKGLSVSRFENRYLHKDGTWSTFLWWASLSEYDGKIYAIAHDQTATNRTREQLQLALQGADLGTWDWHIPSGHVVFNERWAEMLGYTLDEIAPDVSAWEQLVHPDDLPAVQEVLQAHLDGRTEYYETEHRVRHKDGRWIWILDKGRVIERELDGTPLRACGTHLDITARKTAQLEAEKARQRIEYINRLLNTIREVNQLITRQKGSGNFLQPVCETIVAGQGLRNAWIALIDPDSEAVTEVYAAGEAIDLPLLVDVLKSKGLSTCARQALGSETPVVIDVPTPVCPDCPLAHEHAGHTRIVLRLKCDDRRIGVLSLAAPAQFALDPEEMGLIQEMANDVAFALDKAETKNKLEMTEFALETSADSVFWIAPDGRFLFVNRAACEEHGYTREELLSMSVSDIDPDFPADRWPQHWEEMKAAGAMRFISHHRTKEGRVFPVEVYGSFIAREDREYIFAFVHDISARVLREEALQDGSRQLDEARRAALNMMEDALRDKEQMELSARVQHAVIEILHARITNLHEFLNEALNEAIRLTGSRIGYLYLYDEAGQQFILNSWSKEVMSECSVMDPQTCYELNKTGLWGEAVRQRRPILVNDFKADHPHKKGTPEGHVEMNNFLTVPLFSGDAIVAVVGVANKASDYIESDILTLQLLMDSVWAATKNVEVQQALQESEERYRRLAENSPAVVFLFRKAPDGSFSFPYIARSVEAFLGVSAEEAQRDANALLRLIRPDFQETFLNAVLESTDHLTPFELEIPFVRDDGRSGWARAMAMPEAQPDGSILSDGFFVDITDRKRAEEELEANRALLRNIIDTIPGRVWWKDRDLRFLGCNIKFARDAGCEQPEQLLGKKDHDLVPAAQAAGYAAEEHELIASGKARVSVEEHVQAEDGSSRWLEVSKIPLTDAMGRIVGMVGTYSDITERRQAEIALRAAERRNRALLDYSPVCHKIVDLDGNLQYMNRNGFRMLQLEEGSDRYGKPYPFDFFPEAFCKEMRAALERVRQTNAPQVMEGRACNIRGDELWLDSTLIPVPDDAGAIHYITVVTADITESRKSRDELEQSRRLLRSIIDSIPNRVWWKDLNSVFLGANLSIAKDAGFSSPYEVVGKTDYELPWKDQADHFVSDDREVIESGRAKLNIEEVLTRADGTTYWLETNKIPLTDLDGRIIGTVGTYTDITERKRLEEALEKRILALTRPLTDNALPRFEELFSLEEMQRVQDEFSEATGVASVITDPAGIPITRPSNFTRLCRDIIRTTDKGCSSCFKSDAALGRYNPEGPIVQPCLSGGLWDAGVSISVGEHHIANWLIGQVRDEQQSDDAMRAYAREIGADEEAFMAAFHEVPVMSRTHFESIARALFTLADKLSTSAFQNLQQARFIADQKTAEKALRENQEYLEKMWAAMDVGIVLIDAETQQILRANPALQQLSGYTEEELTGMICTDVVCPTLKGQCPARDIGDTPLKGERTLIRKDGRQLDVVKTVSKITLAGRTVFLETLIDVSELRAAEDRLRMLFTAIEQSPETVVITAIDGRIEYVNPAFEQITGYSREEAVGQNPSVLKSGQHPECFYREMWDTLLSGKVWEGRMVNRRKNGSLFTEEASISPVRDEYGVTTHYVAVKRDITRELAHDQELQQAQKMEAVGVLAGGIAHDFNNHLQGIQGFSELLLYALDEDSMEYANALEIKKSAGEAATLTRELLAFSRKQPAESKPVDLNAVIRDAEALITILMGSSHQIEIDLQDSLPDIMADHGQIMQVLMNLAVNARDAMPEGGRFTISTGVMVYQEEDAARNPKAKAGPHVCLSVTDTGTGIPKEIQERIFEPFFTTKEVGKGTGLGLAVIYGIVNQSGGWIHVYSEPGKGTSFILFFPAIRNPCPGTDAPDITAGTDQPARILVVEDNPEIAGLVAEILADHHHQPFIATRANEALEIFSADVGGFDLLISDMEIPDLQGDQLADRIRTTQPDLPILLISGYRDHQRRWEHLEQRGFRFLSKPFTANALMEMISEILSPAGDPDENDPDAAPERSE